MLTEVEKLQRHAKRIANGKDPKVKPGTPARFTEACTINDCIWQGDLGLVIVAGVPEDYGRINRPTAVDRQLVPGNTIGAKHCLDSLDGVELWRPKGWGKNLESLQGPCFLLTKERTVLHPVHGPVTIPAGFAVMCVYQREWDAERRREQRARD